MTNNQIAFWTLEHEKAKTARAQRETERSNKAREDETARSNLAREAETYRSNIAKESETNRSNIARETETKRSNVAKELETARSNRARETETNRANVESESIQRSKLDEERRHNYSSESTKNLEVQTKAFGPIIGSVRHELGKGGTQAEQEVKDREFMEEHSVLGKARAKQVQNIKNEDRRKKSRSRGSR